MTDILVRPSELRASAEQLHASAQRIGQAMQMIDHDISLLRGDKFLGQRATALHSHYAAKREALLKARQLILHFCQDLKTAADVFEKADQQTLPIPPFVTPGIAPTPAEKRFPADWQNIISVSDPDKGITPALIAAVLKYERTHRNLLDGVFDLEAKFILWYEGKLEDSEVAALNLILKLKGESLDSISFGPAQMNPETVRDLVEKGYIAKPDGWDTDQRDVILGMLLNADQAPALVGRFLPSPAREETRVAVSAAAELRPDRAHGPAEALPGP